MRGRCIRNSTGLEKHLTIGKIYELRPDTEGSNLHYNVTLDHPLEMSGGRNNDIYRNRFVMIPDMLNKNIRTL